MLPMPVAIVLGWCKHARVHKVHAVISYLAVARGSGIFHLMQCSSYLML